MLITQEKIKLSPKLPKSSNKGHTFFMKAIAFKAEYLTAIFKVEHYSRESRFMEENSTYVYKKKRI